LKKSFYSESRGVDLYDDMYNMIRKEGGYLLCDLLHKIIIVWSNTPISKRDEVVGDGVGEQRKGLLKHINAIAGVRRLVVGIRRDPHKLLVAYLVGYPNCERSSVFGNHPTSRHRRPTARPYHSLYLHTTDDPFSKSKPKLESLLLNSKCYYIQTENIQRQFVSTDIKVLYPFPKSAPNLRSVSCYIANAITRETSKT
jgi:hypothetical protein